MNAPLHHPVIPAAERPQETDVRLVPCETCQTEGRIYRANGNDPYPVDYGRCPDCEDGLAVVEVQPIICIDLDIPDADYRGADPLTVFALNHERKAAADAAFDCRPERFWWEGD